HHRFHLFPDPTPTHTRPLSLHDALPIWGWCKRKPAIAALTAVVLTLLVTLAASSIIAAFRIRRESQHARKAELEAREQLWGSYLDRKSTRLNSSHLGISYAVFCLKKKRH